MTQHELIIEYIREHGSICPATLKEAQRAYKDQWLGSETIRRCQELENHKLRNVQAYPKLFKHRKGKFIVFTLNPVQIEDTEFMKRFRKEFMEKSKPQRILACDELIGTLF